MFGNSVITFFELADGRGFVHNFCPEAPGSKSIEIIFSPKPAAELACGVSKASPVKSPAFEANLVHEFGGLHDNHRTTFGGSITTKAKEESEAHIAALTAEFDKQKTLIETLEHELQSARIEAGEACKEKNELSHRLEALEMKHAALHSNNAELEDKIEALHDKVDDQREKSKTWSRRSSTLCVWPTTPPRPFSYWNDDSKLSAPVTTRSARRWCSRRANC
jgi:hypothetical protein